MIEKEISLLNLKKRVILCHFKDIKTITNIIMEPIDSQQEKRIDNSKKYYGELRYEKDDTIIPGSDIYLYGEVNLNNNDDLDIIRRFNIIPKDGGRIYSTFDYNSGTFVTENGIPKQYNTWDSVLWFSYCHVLLGKPERVIVYKKVTKKYGR